MSFRSAMYRIAILIALVALPLSAFSQGGAASIVEDRAAKKLLEAGDARLTADETEKAVEIWESVLERYPASKHRFEARMRLGEYFLETKRAFDDARAHYEVASGEENEDPESRAEATLKVGECLFEARDYTRAFSVLREVIEQFPASEQVNHAYHFIGLGHFKQGHYSRAIEALEKVGTAFAEGDQRLDRIEAGRRLFVRIDDRDLTVLGPDEPVTVICRSKVGDEEPVDAVLIGRDATLAIGSIATRLGPPVPNNGVLEVRGGDQIELHYTDQHTADMKFDQGRKVAVTVVGTAMAQILDGQFEEPLGGIVVGRSANLQVHEPDADRSPGVDKLRARAEIHRRKSDEEMEDEKAAAIAKGTPEEEIQIDPWRRIDALDVDLTELVASESDPAGTPVHSPVFRLRLPLEMAEDPRDGAKLEARPGDQFRLVYKDENNLLNQPAERVATAACIEGDLGDVRVSRTEISDRELQIKTSLRTAAALAKIGNHYRDFGLAEPAEAKYGEALDVCNELVPEARQLGGSLLEETYVQLWQIYFAMDEHGRATSMANQLQKEFPESAFIDEAVLQQGQVAQVGKEYDRAIVLYGQVTRLRDSDRRGDAQFGIAECYEAKAIAAGTERGASLFDRAFQEYQKVYEQHPESPKVGQAVAKMANFYYQKKDYARAVDVFETVLSDHPDAEFLDVILYNYGRCLFRLDRKGEAQRQFDQLIAEYPESKLAGEAKRISEALRKQQSAG